MRTKILNALKVSMLALVLTLGLSYVYAWTAPTQAPTGGNIDVPLNTGSTAQAKSGTLQVSGLGAGAPYFAGYGIVTTNVSGIYSQATGSTANGVFGYTPLTGNGVFGDAGGAGNGVYGLSSGGNGVYGLSSNGPGVKGSSALLGVRGIGTDASYGTGVVGQGGNSGMGVGVFGDGQTGVIGQGAIGVKALGTSVADFAAINFGYMYPDGTLQKTAYSAKMCEFALNQSWADAFTVGPLWTRNDCYQEAVKRTGNNVGGYVVGCMGAHGISWGAPGGYLPADNSCGWDVPPPPPPPCPSCSNGCFLAGTLVTMKDGSQKDIEKIKVGEEVVVFNEETGLNTTSPVVEVLHHAPQKQTIYTLTLSNGKTLQPNDIHPMYEVYSNSYIEMKDLYAKYTKGEKVALRDINGSIITISNISVGSQDISVYNLHVRGFSISANAQRALPGNLAQTTGAGHNYYANGILVHNVKTRDPMPN